MGLFQKGDAVASTNAKVMNIGVTPKDIAENAAIIAPGMMATRELRRLALEKKGKGGMEAFPDGMLGTIGENKG